MTDEHLPALKTRIGSLSKGRSFHRLLLVSGLVATSGAVGLFFLTQFTILSAVLAMAALVFLGARQLVGKSLALTSSSSMSLTSIENQLSEIRKQVSKCKFLENVETEGTEAARQADLLYQQYKNLKKVLAQKFTPTEITYLRYLQGIENCSLSIGENLLHVQSLLENLNLAGKGQNEQILQRKSEAKDLLQSTDEAIHSMADLFQSINDVSSKEQHRNQLEHSMQQIQALAERAKNYSKH